MVTDAHTPETWRIDLEHARIRARKLAVVLLAASTPLLVFAGPLFSWAASEILLPARLAQIASIVACALVLLTMAGTQVWWLITSRRATVARGRSSVTTADRLFAGALVAAAWVPPLGLVTLLSALSSTSPPQLTTVAAALLIGAVLINLALLLIAIPRYRLRVRPTYRPTYRPT